MSLTYFPQETRTSCTVACLRMVLNHWGIIVVEESLRACCQHTNQGTVARHAITCAKSYGLLAEERRRTTWSEMTTFLQQDIYPIMLLNLFPLKAHWVRHAVVLESIENQTIHYLDPIYGHSTAPQSAFDQAWLMNRRRAIIIQPEV